MNNPMVRMPTEQECNDYAKIIGEDGKVYTASWFYNDAEPRLRCVLWADENDALQGFIYQDELIVNAL